MFKVLHLDQNLGFVLQREQIVDYAATLLYVPFQPGKYYMNGSRIGRSEFEKIILAGILPHLRKVEAKLVE